MKSYGIEKGTYYTIKITDTFKVEDLPHIKKAAETGITTGHKFLAFDLSECRSIGSSGVGLISNLHKQCLKRGGKVVLLNPTPEVRNVIMCSRLSTVIEIHNTEEDLEMALF